MNLNLEFMFSYKIEKWFDGSLNFDDTTGFIYVSLEINDIDYGVIFAKKTKNLFHAFYVMNEIMNEIFNYRVNIAVNEENKRCLNFKREKEETKDFILYRQCLDSWYTDNDTNILISIIDLLTIGDI